jgi:hypothetical protein
MLAKRRGSAIPFTVLRGGGSNGLLRFFDLSFPPDLLLGVSFFADVLAALAVACFGGCFGVLVTGVIFGKEVTGAEGGCTGEDFAA